MDIWILKGKEIDAMNWDSCGYHWFTATSTCDKSKLMTKSIIYAPHIYFLYTFAITKVFSIVLLIFGTQIGVK